MTTMTTTTTPSRAKIYLDDADQTQDITLTRAEFLEIVEDEAAVAVGDALAELRERLAADAEALSAEGGQDGSSTAHAIRVVKAEGVRLALSYVDEVIRGWA